jgi:hypothetical protein
MIFLQNKQGFADFGTSSRLYPGRGRYASQCELQHFERGLGRWARKDNSMSPVWTK